MDRIDAMTTLIAAVDGGSLSAASRNLGMPLATVSRKVSELEAHLRTKLVIRTSRKLMLTEPGRAYVAASRRILEEIDETERAASGEYGAPQGHLTITAPIMFGRLHVEPVVLAFLQAYPDIQARLILADHVVNLVDDHIEVAIRIGRLPDSAMVATQVGTMRMVTCISPALLGSHGMPAVPGDLQRFPCVAVEAPMPSSGWRFRDPGSGAPRDVAISARLAVSTPEAAAAAAVRGVGAARLLHYQAADALRQGALHVVLAEYELEPAPVHLLHAARGQMPLKMRRFLDFAAPRLRLVLGRFASGEAPVA